MTKDEEYASAVQAHLEQLFPRQCSCGVEFSCHGEYLERATPIAVPVSLDAVDGFGADAETADPIGMIAYANCNACGSSLAMSTIDMPVELRRELRDWVRDQAPARGLTLEQLMQSVRRRIQAISRAAWNARRGATAVSRRA